MVNDPRGIPPYIQHLIELVWCIYAYGYTDYCSWYAGGAFPPNRERSPNVPWRL